MSVGRLFCLCVSLRGSLLGLGRGWWGRLRCPRSWVCQGPGKGVRLCRAVALCTAFGGGCSGPGHPPPMFAALGHVRTANSGLRGGRAGGGSVSELASFFWGNGLCWMRMGWAEGTWWRHGYPWDTPRGMFSQDNSPSFCSLALWHPHADHSPAGLLRAPIHGFFPKLAQLLVARLSPGLGFLSVQAGALAWQRRTLVVVGSELFLPS